MALFNRRNSLLEDKKETVLYQKSCGKPYRLTPFIITFYEGTLTDIDIENLLEAGLRVIRFKISHVATSDKVVLLSYLKQALNSCRAKHENYSWPVAISIDLPNACILTGYLRDEIKYSRAYLRKDSIVEVTSDSQYWNKCDDKRIFIDDPLTLATLKPGNEISINLGAMLLICKEVINNKCIKCEVELGGFLKSAQIVCIRGVRHRRPPLSKLDKRLIDFVKENELDIITIHSIRNPTTITKIRSFFKDCPVKPFIMCSICEQEGLDKVDSIVEVSDGVILAREFLSQAIINPNKLTAIQMYVSAKCRQHNKPFYISGNILENTLKHGTITCHEISDVAHAVKQGAGFLLRSYSTAANVVTAMHMLNEMCEMIETGSLKEDFWRMCLQLKPPTNAADAAIHACALTVKQTETQVVIVPTVTGRSAILLAPLVPQTIVIAVTVNAAVGRQLQMYRGIMALVYQKSCIKDWDLDMAERIKFAVQYCVKNEMLRYDQSYVVLRKATSSSAFCDLVSSWKVVLEQHKKQRVNCPDRYGADTSASKRSRPCYHYF